MNRLSIERRAQILSLLVEGNSLRATTRIAGASVNTVSKLLVDVGTACAEYQDKVMHDLDCEHLEIDEIWSFVYAKKRNVPDDLKGVRGYGDVWTWVAIDANTKLLPSYLVGERNGEDAVAFVNDLARRMAHRVQLTTDGHHLALYAVRKVFQGDVDYATLKKYFANATGRSQFAPEQRYSPGKCIAQDARVILGDPKGEYISTSYVERQNLTMRMGMRRFTRLTNAFSKQVENHAAAVSLHFMHYNFVRPHKALRNPYPRTPALAAGVADRVWTLADIARLAN